jgi:hypothetical protein
MSSLDLNNTALQAVEDAVNAVAMGALQFVICLPIPRCHFVPNMNLADISPSEDARGQVDFEIGVRQLVSPVCPFIFSVFIAFKRYTNNKM